jgi:hypothetical protein
MPSPFAALEDQLSTAVDSVFAEDFVFLPMSQPTPNSRRGVDNTRTGRTFKAVFDDRIPGATSFARLSSRNKNEPKGDGPPSFKASQPLIFFDERYFSGGDFPQRLDRVRRVDTSAVYEITGVEKDGQGRWKLPLTQVAQD